ncbi:MAG: cupin domain-containing protein [Acidobacteriota bacterium]
MKKVVTLALAFTLAALGAALAQEMAAPSKTGKTGAAKASASRSKPMHKIMNAGDIQWGDAPPNMPPGAKMAVLQGDPGKSGLFTVRLKAPDGYTVAAHWHPTDEHLTVISGTFNLQTGDGADMSSATAMTAGAFATMPAKMRHKAVCQGETEVQVSGMGPFKVIYVNPADDPSNKKAQ